MADIGINCLQKMSDIPFFSIDKYPIGVYNENTPWGYLRTEA